MQAHFPSQAPASVDRRPAEPTSRHRDAGDRAPEPLSPEAAWTLLDRQVQELLERVGDGCQRSFAQLYEQTSPRLYAIVAAVVPRQEHAEIVLQDLYARLWSERAEREPSLEREPHRRGMSWLISRARHAAIASGYRGRGKVTLRELSPFGPARVDHSTAATRAALASPTPQALRDCLCALPDGPRQALTLAFYEGLDYEEIATLLGQDAGTVRDWLRTAIERLRASDGAEPPAST